MRWLPFTILAYLTVGVQAGIGGYARFGGAWPNFVLLAVVFISIYAPRDAALLGCVILGLMQDLLTAAPMGTWALCYGVAGFFVVSVQDVVYRGHFLTHLTLVLIAGLLVALVWSVHEWVYPMLHSAPRPARQPLGPFYGSAVYSAALAPVVLGVLERTKGAFGFRPGRAYGGRH